MKNQKYLLVLSLLSITDKLTRKVLATNIQKNLFKLGLKWDTSGANFEHLEADYICVADGKLLTCDGSPYVFLMPFLTLGHDAPKLFSVETQYGDFLDAAKKITEPAPNKEEKVHLDPATLDALKNIRASAEALAEFLQSGVPKAPNLANN